MPSKYRAFKEAADRIVELERDLAARDAELAAMKDDLTIAQHCHKKMVQRAEAAERERDELRADCANMMEGNAKQFARAEAAERKAEESARDAARYRFIRDDDNWQDDAPDTATWDNLGELSMAEFDAAVDKKMSAAYWEKNPIQAAIAAKGEA